MRSTFTIRLAIIAMVFSLSIPWSPHTASSQGSPPQLFEDSRFFEEPDFFLQDLIALLRSQPGRLDVAAVEGCGMESTAAEALYAAGNAYTYSVNVKLLLTVMELSSGLVTHPPLSPAQLERPMGLEAPLGFEAQAAFVAESLVEAYSACAPSVVLEFPDGSSFAFPEETNKASCAIMTVLARLAPDRATWEAWTAPQIGDFATTIATFATVRKPLVGMQQQFPGDGDPAFLYRPYAGEAVAVNSYLDHKYPDYKRNGTVVIFTGQSSGNCAPYCYDGHDAYDYNSNGRSVVAAADGIVDLVHTNCEEPGVRAWCEAAGYKYTPVNAVIIRHDPDGDGTVEFKTRYWHLAAIGINPKTGQIWADGDEIEQGKVIGPTGATGCADGPHLHFAVTRNGRIFDPYGWGGDTSDPWDPNFWLWSNSNASYPAETMYIDSPAQNAHVMGVVQVSGWAINRKYGPDTGVDRIVMYLDDEARTGQYLGEAGYGDYRPDVGNAFGDPRFNYSGFHFDWNTSAVPPGEHSLYIYSRSVEKNNWFFYKRTVIVESDPTPPTIPIIQPPSGPDWYSTFTRLRQPSFTWIAAQDPESGIKRTCASTDRPDPLAGGPNTQCWEGTGPSSWTVPLQGEGPHTLYVRAENKAGLPSAAASFSFAVDTTPPTLPSTISAGCTNKNNLWQNTCRDPVFAWSGATDNGGSGVKDYHYYWGDSPSATPNQYTSSTGFDPGPISEPGSCATYYLNMATRDNLLQEGVSGPAFVLKYDDVSPTANVIIDGGADTTNQVIVHLDIAADDGTNCSGTKAMRISDNQIQWTEWLPYEPEMLWQLPALNRRWLSVYLQVKDRAGNVSEVAQDTIYLEFYPEKPHSDNYRICAAVVDTGGMAKSSTSFTLVGAIGQPWAGSGLSGSAYQGTDGLLGTWGGCATAWDFPTTYTLTNSIIASGGNLKQSPSFQQAGTLGQVVAAGAETLTSPGYQLSSGFWSGITSPVPPILQAPPSLETSLPPALPEPEDEPEEERFGILAGELGLNFTNQITTVLALWAPAAQEVQISPSPDFLATTWQTFVPTMTWYYMPVPEIVTGTHIYARFRDEQGTIYGAYESTVFYDCVLPVGAAEVLTITAGMATLRLDASDDNSGVFDMRLGTDLAFDGAGWQIYTDTVTTTWPSSGTLFVQFRDRAGNRSDLVTVRDRYLVYLPLILKH